MFPWMHYKERAKVIERKKYYIKLPGSFHAMGPITAKNESHARAYFRNWLKLRALPRYTEVWEAT